MTIRRASRVPERLGTIAESWQARPDEPIPEQRASTVFRTSALSVCRASTV